MSEVYYNVKLNNGCRTIVYGKQEDLEAMYQNNIIDTYVIDSSYMNVDGVYKQYVCDELEEKVHDICYKIQNAKGIKNGELPPDLGIDLSMAIDKVADIVEQIIKVEQNIDKEK